MHTIFFLTSIAMFVACLAHANAMNGGTRIQMKAALWILMAGDVAQVLADLYGFMHIYAVISATVISVAITIWLACERSLQREHANDHSG